MVLTGASVFFSTNVLRFREIKQEQCWRCVVDGVLLQEDYEEKDE
jgi:hypothetical protein